MSILNNHHQNNGECNHVKTYPPTADGHLILYHKPFHQDQMKQQQQPQYQLNGNFVHHESCILMPRYVPANDLQRINCSHRRIRHFSGHQINEVSEYHKKIHAACILPGNTVYFPERNSSTNYVVRSLRLFKINVRTNFSFTGK